MSKATEKDWEKCYKELLDTKTSNPMYEIGYNKGRIDAINDVLDIIGFRNLDDISQRYIYAKKLINDIYKLRDS